MHRAVVRQTQKRSGLRENLQLCPRPRRLEIDTTFYFDLPSTRRVEVLLLVMSALHRLPAEMLMHILSYLGTVDHGNCAMTCQRLYRLIDPILEQRLKRLVFANPDIMRLVESDDVSRYGIDDHQLQNLDDSDVDPVVIRDHVLWLAEAFCACPLLVKYIKHVFIDYIQVSEYKLGFQSFDDNGHVFQLHQILKPDQRTNAGHDIKTCTSISGVVAMLFSILPNVESLVLTNCNPHPNFPLQDSTDLIMTAAAADSLSTGSRQTRLCNLRHIYATGCRMTGFESRAPWELLVLPSVESMECRDSNGPLLLENPPMPTSGESLLLGSAVNWNRVSHLKHLDIRQEVLDYDGFYELIQCMHSLQSLKYKHRLSKQRSGPRLNLGIHAERFGEAIQSLCDTLEELTIEIGDVQDLWGLEDWDRTDDSDFLDTEAESDDSSVGEDGDTMNIIEGEDDLGEVAHDGILQRLEFAEDLDLPRELDIYDDDPTFYYEPYQPLVWQSREASWDDLHPGFMGSLANFQCLKTIKLPAMTLQKSRGSGRSDCDRHKTVLYDGLPEDTSHPRLKDLLPRSLEHLTLFDCKERLPDLDQDIEDLWASAPASFPNLKDVSRITLPPVQVSTQFHVYVEDPRSELEIRGSNMVRIPGT